MTLEIPFILFLDPLDYHSTGEECCNIWLRLNVEWKTTAWNLFSTLPIKFVSPEGKQTSSTTCQNLFTL